MLSTSLMLNLTNDTRNGSKAKDGYLEKLRDVVKEFVLNPQTVFS